MIVSMLLNILTVIFLALTMKEIYTIWHQKETALVFLLFVLKGFLLGRVGKFER